ncbi:membrane protein [Leifsonia rubra CMS 76R]|nr:membrane protein [Leifsonia rubra CMS 76R]
MVRATQHTSALIFDGLEELSADRVYELWCIDGSGARPASLLDAFTDGPTWRVLDGEKAPDDVIGVTIEPKGGSMHPPPISSSSSKAPSCSLTAASGVTTYPNLPET